MRIENEFSEMARWRDGEMGRERWRDGFFYKEEKRKREKEKKRKRGKEEKSLIQTRQSKQTVQLYLLHYKE
ncbi:MAG TPA: hypothetical protein PKI37_03200 [Candidatus Cloacimonas sp.]|nr:hypothetical protein [Candidatus Cloacimonas sp.]